MDKATEPVRKLKALLNSARKIDSALSQVIESPVDRHILLSYALSNEGLFHYSYDDFKVKRINKILDLYDLDWFQGKKVLELGGGHGDIGAFLAEIGAEVLTLDGRRKNVNFAKLKHRHIANYQCRQFNLENDFSEFGKFDLIINFGLLYHLKNVDEHLHCCFQNSREVLFETVVCNSRDPEKIIFYEEDINIDEEALEGTGCRPSPFYVERIAKENHFEVIRHFSSDLNSGDLFVYDWDHEKDRKRGDDFSLRRFWRFVRQD
jgi:SAM-dependent methyltransferase